MPFFTPPQGELSDAEIQGARWVHFIIGTTFEKNIHKKVMNFDMVAN